MGVKFPSTVLLGGTCPMDGFCFPMHLFTIGLEELPAEMPPKGPNFGSPQQRLLISQGSGQHRDLLSQAPAFRHGVADSISFLDLSLFWQPSVRIFT
jgi:hypothetical protein